MRPRVGVILAAGQARRLVSVTHGRSKMLLSVGGLPLVERAARMLLAAGLERVVVVVGYRGDEVGQAAARADPSRVEVIHADRWDWGNGASLAAAAEAVAGEELFVLLCADIVFAEGALDDLVSAEEPAVLVDPSPSPQAWAEGTRVHQVDGRAVALSRELPDRAIDCGAFVFGQDIFEYQRRAEAQGNASLTAAFAGLAAARGLQVVPLRPGTLWQDVDTPKDLRAARRVLRRSLSKASDAPIFHYMYRPVSTRLTMLLAPLRIPPNALTCVACLLGLAAAWALAEGMGLLAGILIQLNTVLDGVDGETARLHFRSSPRGAVIDAVIDRIVDGSLVAGVALWVWPFHPSFEFKVAIVSSSAYGWGFLAYLFRESIVGFEVGAEERPLVLLLGGRDSRLLILSIGSVLYQPGAAVAVGWAIYLASVFRRMFLRRRRPPPAPGVSPTPHDVGQAADRDLHEIGEEPEHQHGRHDRVTRGAGQHQASDVPELDDPHVSRDDRHGRSQADEGEHGEHHRPAGLRVGDSGEPQAGQEHQVQGELTDHFGGGQEGAASPQHPDQPGPEPQGRVPPSDHRWPTNQSPQERGDRSDQ